MENKTFGYLLDLNLPSHTLALLLTCYGRKKSRSCICVFPKASHFHSLHPILVICIRKILIR